MPYQIALTIRADVRAGARTAELLSALRTAMDSGDDPFAAMPTVHFARLFLLPGDDGLDVAESLVYMADVDDPKDTHLAELARQTTGPLAEVLQCWTEWPDDGDGRIRWLHGHGVPPAASYVHHVGLSATQIRANDLLRQAVDAFLETRDWAGLSDVEVHREVRRFVGGRADLCWALEPPAGPGGWFAVREGLHAVLWPTIALMILPLTAAIGPAWLAALRVHEALDVPETAPADPSWVHRLEAIEDTGPVPNPFTVAGRVKPGPVRWATIRTALVALDYACRHLYNTDNLQGIRSIHFARWVPIDGDRRLMFASSYDGSQESYMNDFIDRVAWGINLVFSNGAGFPPTRWLIFGGTHDEQAYKTFLRRRQLPSVWYSAYPALSARNVDDDARFRAGLIHELDTEGAQEWLATV
jgi:hypothetical protein